MIISFQSHLVFVVLFYTALSSSISELLISQTSLVSNDRNLFTTDLTRKGEWDSLILLWSHGQIFNKSPLPAGTELSLFTFLPLIPRDR